MAQRRENPIPIEHRQAVYSLGLDYTEIVYAREISNVPHVFDVHLRKGGRDRRATFRFPSSPWPAGNPPGGPAQLHHGLSHLRRLREGVARIMTLGPHCWVGTKSMTRPPGPIA